MKTEKQLTITTIEELKKAASGEIVELPSFSQNCPFVARVKRPSLLALVKAGKIPNALLVRTNELFTNDGAGFDPENKSLMSEMYEVLVLIAGETLVEPSLDDIQNAGIELTDEQLMFLFNYSQQGVKALESFRSE